MEMKPHEKITPESDDLLKLLETLKENEADYDKALSQWNVDYNDVLRDDVLTPPRLYGGHIGGYKTHPGGFRRVASESVLRRNRYSSINTNNMEQLREDGYFDLSTSRDDDLSSSPFRNDLSSSPFRNDLSSSPFRNDLSSSPFRNDLSSSSFSIDTTYEDDYEGFEDETTLVEELADNLTKDHLRVGEKLEEMDELLKLMKDEHEMSGRLQDDVASAHRSLTMLELRQEKIIREALYDNVTANTTVRQLQDEVVQLRLREAQNRDDLQRLTAENSRLKLKVMELRKCSLKPPLPRQQTTKQPTTTQQQSKKIIKPKVRSSSPGLMAFEHLAHDDDIFDATVVHRGTMGKFARVRTNASQSAPSCSSAGSGGYRAPYKPVSCPLCGHTDPPTSDDDVTITAENVTSSSLPSTSISRGTSTSEIENIIALRSSVHFLGYNIPIPLFIAVLIRVIDNCLLMIGHLCFAEYPPLNFPELRYNAIKVLREVRARLQVNTVYS